MPIFMVSPRDYTLRTLHGHVIHFPAETPVSVPDSVVSEALAVNIMPAREGHVAAREGAAGTVSQPIVLTATLRDAIIFQTIKDLVAENDTANFNAGGQPKVAVLNGLTGIRLSGTELTKYWDRYREIVGSNSPLPTHPNAENVMELQRLTTRKQLIEFAEAISVDRKEVERRSSIKEAKEHLMSAAIAYNETATAFAPDTSSLVEQ